MQLKKLIDSIKIPKRVNCNQISEIILNKNNVHVSSQIGLHRTLCYLKPILHKIVPVSPDVPSGFELLFTAQKLEKTFTHGALIVVPYPEMISSTYAYIRHVSPLLNVFRTNNSCDVIGEVRLKAENKSQNKEEKIVENFKIKSLNWKIFDVVITLPSYLDNLFTITPEFVVLDSINQ